MANFRYYTEGTTKVRIGIRVDSTLGRIYATDITLTGLNGFDGTEGVNWENLEYSLIT